MNETKPTTIIDAMSAVIGEIQDPPLDAVNPHFRSKYSSLPAVLKTIRPLASKYGLAVVQLVNGNEVVTKVTHISGGEITSSILLPPNTTMQALGSAITYARRYALTALFAICGDEDDDGNETSKPAQAKPTTAKPKVNSSEKTLQAGDKLVKGVTKEGKKWFAIQRGTEKVWLSEAQFDYLSDMQNSQTDLIKSAEAIFNAKPNEQA